MLKFIFAGLLAFGAMSNANAELYYEGGYNPNLTLQQQLAADHPYYPRPIIFVFYNNNPCYECPQTIDLIEDVYNANYQDTYNLYIINYQDDENYNFIQNYNLSQPLEVVLQQVVDGKMTNFIKLENLQTQISDPTSFFDNLTYQINNFFDQEE